MKGKVYLVGAGPGDYRLITLKGLQCIKTADVIVYDNLVSKNLIGEARKSCEFIYVGKQSRKHTKTQDEINEIISEKAKGGKIVTRLKGGDPYVFGRGGEEGQFLRERGIEFEVVPGITSAIGGLCYAGIPITHRDFASSFHVITGHLKEEDKELDWKNLASLQGTLVFLMGVSNLENICENLIKEGKDKTTPAAIINWATTPHQKVIDGNLENIYSKAVSENIKPPSLIVVGEVVALRESLNFFEEKPLFGKNVVVTRARAQSSSLVQKVSELGGNPIEFPTIKIEEITPNEELDREIVNLEKYTYLIFTSENGVEIFFKRLFQLDFDSRKLSSLKVVAIGPATFNAIRKYGITPDIMPERFVGEAIVEELRSILTKKDKILMPRASNARDYLFDELSKICEVVECSTYRTVKGEGHREEILELLEEQKVDYITFTSSSTVKNFIEIIGKENLCKLSYVKLISIGPITSKTIEDLGLKLHKEAEEYTIDGVIDAIVSHKK